MSSGDPLRHLHDKMPRTRPHTSPPTVCDTSRACVQEDVKEWWWITMSTFTFVYLAAAICKTYVELFTTAGATAFSTFP